MVIRDINYIIYLVYDLKIIVFILVGFVFSKVEILFFFGLNMFLIGMVEAIGVVVYILNYVGLRLFNY